MPDQQRMVFEPNATPLMGYSSGDEAGWQATNKAAHDPSIPFSLICHGNCDAGTEIIDIDAATSAGWRCISYEPDGLSWNFIGDCPECIIGGCYE